MELREYLKDRFLILDGGMGTLLQAKGLARGELPERWNISHRDDVTAVHRRYYDAGSNIVSTNTFGANGLKFSDAELEEIVRCAVENAKEAQKTSTGVQEKWIALDIGPSGKMLEPLGTLAFEDAVECFAKTVRLGVKYGVDAIMIETMGDCYEIKAAMLAAKENSNLPIFVSCAYGADGKLMTGADPEAVIALVEGLGADLIGVNCSLGPKALSGIVRRYLAWASVPVLFKPNAGLPKVVDGRATYDVSPEDFAKEVADLAKEGVCAMGGCCGTTPEYIAALVKAIQGIERKPLVEKQISVVSSYTHAVTFGKDVVLIGERINPAGKPSFIEELQDGEIDTVLDEGQEQQQEGAHMLDLNVSVPDTDEGELLCEAVSELQAICNLPLSIDTADAGAMERAVRRYNGKPLLNSLTGCEKSMEQIFPIAKKYGGVIVCLTMDEKGIPETAAGRGEIAKRILKRAEEYGIKKKDLIFDPLALSIGTTPEGAAVTLDAVEMIRKDLGCCVLLGVSNVSFGLPMRQVLNATFFTMAMERGLCAAIMNPACEEMMQAYLSHRALIGSEDGLCDYLDRARDAK